LSHILDYPLAVFLVSFLMFWLSVTAGCGLATKVREAEDKNRDDLSLISNASLTLLALVIGFSFSMALGRYDQRRNYEEEEANAIGTEYVRVDLLPEADAKRVQGLLTQYLDQRLLFYTTRDESRVVSIENESSRLEGEMWMTVQTSAKANPSSPMILVVSGMNDVLNRTGYTVAAWRYRVPPGAWATMIFLSIGCSVLIGFSAKRKRRLLMAFPLLVSIAMLFISDIDSPRRGLIRVPPVNLISLSQSLHGQ
jgi:hypothetical protein